MKAIALALLLVCLPAVAQDSAAPKRTLEQTIADYVGLYRADSLPEWKLLFHPQLTVVFPEEDGTVVVRSLEQFYEAQANYLPTHAASERLENVHIDRGRRIARVSADFVFVDEGTESRGKLGLHLIEGSEGWRIVGIVFSYDDEERKSVTGDSQ